MASVDASRPAENYETAVNLMMDTIVKDVAETLGTPGRAHGRPSEQISVENANAVAENNDEDSASRNSGKVTARSSHLDRDSSSGPNEVDNKKLPPKLEVADSHDGGLGSNAVEEDYSNDVLNSPSMPPRLVLDPNTGKLVEESQRSTYGDLRFKYSASESDSKLPEAAEDWVTGFHSPTASLIPSNVLDINEEDSQARLNVEQLTDQKSQIGGTTEEGYDRLRVNHKADMIASADDGAQAEGTSDAVPVSKTEYMAKEGRGAGLGANGMHVNAKDEDLTAEERFAQLEHNAMRALVTQWGGELHEERSAQRAEEERRVYGYDRAADEESEESRTSSGKEQLQLWDAAAQNYDIDSFTVKYREKERKALAAVVSHGATQAPKKVFGNRPFKWQMSADVIPKTEEERIREQMRSRVASALNEHHPEYYDDMRARGSLSTAPDAAQRERIRLRDSERAHTSGTDQISQQEFEKNMALLSAPFKQDDEVKQDQIQEKENTGQRSPGEAKKNITLDVAAVDDKVSNKHEEIDASSPTRIPSPVKEVEEEHIHASPQEATPSPQTQEGFVMASATMPPPYNPMPDIVESEAEENLSKTTPVTSGSQKVDAAVGTSPRLSRSIEVMTTTSPILEQSPKSNKPIGGWAASPAAGQDVQQNLFAGDGAEQPEKAAVRRGNDPAKGTKTLELELPTIRPLSAGSLPPSRKGERLGSSRQRSRNLMSRGGLRSRGLPSGGATSNLSDGLLGTQPNSDTQILQIQAENEVPLVTNRVASADLIHPDIQDHHDLIVEAEYRMHEQEQNEIRKHKEKQVPVSKNNKNPKAPSHKPKTKPKPKSTRAGFRSDGKSISVNAYGRQPKRVKPQNQQSRAPRLPAMSEQASRLKPSDDEDVVAALIARANVQMETIDAVQREAEIAADAPAHEVPILPPVRVHTRPAQGNGMRANVRQRLAMYEQSGHPLVPKLPLHKAKRVGGVRGIKPAVAEVYSEYGPTHRLQRAPRVLHDVPQEQQQGTNLKPIPPVKQERSSDSIASRRLPRGGSGSVSERSPPREKAAPYSMPVVPLTERMTRVEATMAGGRKVHDNGRNSKIPWQEHSNSPAPKKSPGRRVEPEIISRPQKGAPLMAPIARTKLVEDPSDGNISLTPSAADRTDSKASGQRSSSTLLLQQEGSFASNTDGSRYWKW